MCVRVVLLCVAMVGTAAADNLLQVADLGWPAGTTSATFKSESRVLAEPGTGKRIAVADRGTRVSWRRIVASKDGCTGWLELDHGWACATDLAPAKDAVAKAVDPTARWAQVVAAGADAFDDLAALRTGLPSRHVDTHSDVAVRGGVQVIDGGRYLWTDQGWIAAGDLTVLDPSPWAGFTLKADAKLDFGWSVARKPGAKIAVHETADETARVVRQLAPRDMVTVQEARGEWSRLDGGWVLTVELRRPEKRTRPDGVGEHERWIDVDLDQQVLMLYEGDTPVFTTLVSTGRLGDWQTPTGIYRVRDKTEKARMHYTPPEEIPGVTESWDVADVPYVMGFRRNFALHGTYWHDGFGRQRSHGCVNLSPQDAKTVFDFVVPYFPTGFTDIEAGDDGTPVQLHDRHDPTPKWLDYDGHVLKDVADK